MTSPNPAEHPLPISPDPNISPIATIPLALPPDTPDFPASPHSHPTFESESETQALIASLQLSLTTAQQTISNQTTKLSTLSDIETELVQLKDQYAFLSAAKEAVEIQLKEEIKKREVAEENVEMLRGQVEQARRGVMVLQKQDADRKRMSIISSHSNLTNGILGLGLNGEEEILSSTSNNTDNSSTGSKESKLVKRQSIMRSHRRQSSQSEPSDLHDQRALVTSPNSQNQNTTNGLRPIGQGGLRELRLGHTSPSSAIITPSTANLPSPNLSTHNNPHQSGYFDDNSEPPSSVLSKTTDLPSKKEIEAIEEAARLKGELTNLQNKLEEAEEARIASETCLKALREFMATDPNVKKDGEEMSESTADLLKGIRLPPLPTDRDADEEQRHAEVEKSNFNKQQNTGTGGWGFKLWNAKQNPNPNATSPNNNTNKELLSSPQKALSPIENRSRAGSTATVSPLPTPLSEDIPTPTTTTSLTNSISSGQTPLSSFVSNWTKGVSSPPISSSTSSSPQVITERPTNTRKISVTNFFSRGTKKEIQPEPPVKEEIEKELPTPPSENTESISVPNKSLEPSPEIEIKELSEDDNRRLSKMTNGTTVTELEDELGTPQNSLKGINTSVDGEGFKVEVSDKGKERMDEISL